MSFKEMYFSGKQITVDFSGKNIDVIMQNGFFLGVCSSDKNPVHRHKYTEIHFTTKGRSEYIADGKKASIDTGEILVIPKGVHHRFLANEYGLKSYAFQIGIEVHECRKYQILPSVLEELLAEMQKFVNGGSAVKLSAYLCVILSTLSDDWKISVSDIKDREFLMHEFLEKNYASDISLADLAEVLNLSEKQTERVVKENTGNTFRQEIKKRRIEWAKQLFTSSSATMDEIARLVGYKSYSGFWKATKSDKDI